MWDGAEHEGMKGIIGKKVQLLLPNCFQAVLEPKTRRENEVHGM